MKRLLIAVVACAALVSCGSDELAARASRDLSARVAAIQEAVERGDPALAQLLLERLQGAVDRWVADGLLTEERATTINSAADDVVAQLVLLSADATPPESSSPSSTPTVDPGAEDEDDEEGEDHGNSGPGNGEDHDNSGHGNGKDFGDD
ncbi:MAG TPA: hypothetical protein VGR41_00155 [Actinomycetota bacterium]|jgi:hypothetical protein|nr:hypothetical protein [Actinomycetota bacterium]